MLIFENEKKMVVENTNRIVAIVCNVCKKKITDEMELQEVHHISFTGGYRSVFGDENYVAGEICQQCLKEKLGEYLEINYDSWDRSCKQEGFVPPDKEENPNAFR